MKNKVWLQNDITKKDNSQKRNLSRLKKAFWYLLLLWIVESNIGNAQIVQSWDSSKKLASKVVTQTVSVDHNRLINTNVDSLNIDIVRNELLAEINAARAKKWLKPLVLDEDLNSTAMKHAQYMDANNRYHHEDKNWITPSKRVKATGYGKIFMWENIHDGPRSIYYVMQDRMKSALHANNIEWEFSEDIGIGYCNGYWVLDFGGRYPWIKRDVIKK